MVLSPNEKKQAIPPLVFSYFDPIKENYVTARSEVIPIQVQGGAAPAPTAVTSTSSLKRAPTLTKRDLGSLSTPKNSSRRTNISQACGSSSRKRACPPPVAVTRSSLSAPEAPARRA